MSEVLAPDPKDLSRSLANLRLERDAVALYEGLAGVERDPRRVAAFRAIAEAESRHAQVWSNRLASTGAEVPPPGRPGWRVRVVVALARILGTHAVSELARGIEEREGRAYLGQAGPEVEAILEEEQEHVRVWRELGVAGETAAAETTTRDRTGRGRAEVWRRAGQSGTLRAAVFGINDGLVSNLALVMGVAGALVDNSVIVLAGIAGLLSGAFSMGAGEYISMRSQRELFERRIDLERDEMRIAPELVTEDLAAIYRAKGLPEDEAAMVAHRLMEDPRHALDTKLREELGIDPDGLGSPWGAAIFSFAAFGLGALVPLAPFLLASGIVAVAFSVALALTSLFVVGALVSFLTGRSLLFSGLRQMAIGGGAAIITFAVGTLIGIQSTG